MDATHPPTTDPVELVRRLDARTIRDRLKAIDRERAALLVLLRAALRACPADLAPPRAEGRP
jgi:hypothetical protein